LDPAMPVYIGNLSENRYLKLKVYNIRRYGKIVFLNYRRGSQCPSTNQFWVLASFQSRNEIFFTRSRKSRDYAEAYNRYAAQEIPQIDVEIVKKSHLWMGTDYFLCFST